MPSCCCAQVLAGTLEEFVELASTAAGGAVVSGLPVITRGMSDSWGMGMGSDPIKTAESRAIHRAIAEWNGDRSAPAFLNFSRQFIKAGEHTCVCAFRFCAALTVAAHQQRSLPVVSEGSDVLASWGLASRYLGPEWTAPADHQAWSNGRFHR